MLGGMERRVGVASYLNAERSREKVGVANYLNAASSGEKAESQ